MTTNQKQLLRIFSSALLFTLALLPFWGETGSLLLFVTAFLLVGGDILLRAARNLFHGEVFDENLLMSLATVGAFAVGEYPEGVAVMLFYQVGEYFQQYAVNRSRRSIADLMDIRPETAHVQRGDTLETVEPEEVQRGETLVIRPGERVPLDAVVLTGESSLDTAALTGESLPRTVGVGDALPSGCINLSGLLTATVTREWEDSTVSKILELVENAGNRKSKSEHFITKFARYYTPGVVLAAAVLAVLPPLLFGGEWGDWIYRALTFLVISCPCALVISIPLSFFGGIGAASRQGILVKGSNYLEALAAAEVMVFDKTGTLTQGKFAVQQLHPVGLSEQEFLRLIAHAEAASSHPISRSLVAAYSGDLDEAAISAVEEIAGQGVIATIDGKRVGVGNQRLCATLGAAAANNDSADTTVHLVVDGVYCGFLTIADQPKPDAAAAIAALKADGQIRRTVMLTGDNRQIAERIAHTLGIDEVCAELLPADKVEALERLLGEVSPKGKLAYVGDGINDAPVLARADLGLAMGGLGSDAAIEAADIVIMTDEPSKILTAIGISRKTLAIVRQNIVFALGVKGLVLLLGATGYASMWAAVFADVGVSVLAILNAMRLLLRR